MAVTMAQAAANEVDPVRRGALEIASTISTVWDRLPFEDIQGNAYAYDKDRVLPGTAFRTVNEAYVESTGVVNQDIERLTILGGDADVDRFIEKTFSAETGVLLADQMAMKVESANATFVNAFFNGDVNIDPKGFDGLKKRLIGSQVIDSSANLGSDALLAELDLLFAQVYGGTPDVVYTSGPALARLKALARKTAGAEYVLSEITGRREFTWNGVPFLDPGETFNGSPILPYSTTAIDFYAVKFARSWNQVGVMGITNGGLQAYDLGELQEKPAYRARVEFYAGLVAQGGKAAARLRGVTQS